MGRMIRPVANGEGVSAASELLDRAAPATSVPVVFIKLRRSIQFPSNSHRSCMQRAALASIATARNSTEQHSQRLRSHPRNSQAASLGASQQINRICTSDFTVRAKL